MPFSIFLDSVQSERFFIATCEESLERVNLSNLPSNSLTVAIGPEGDFSPDELSKASNKGAEALSLGVARLRTETAGIHLVSVVNHLFSAQS